MFTLDKFGIKYSVYKALSKNLTKIKSKVLIKTFCFWDLTQSFIEITRNFN